MLHCMFDIYVDTMYNNNNYDSFLILSACIFDCTLGARVLYNMTVCSSYCSFCCTGVIKYTGAIEKAETCRKF